MGFFERITHESVPKLPHNFNLSVNRGTQNRVPFGSVGSIPSAGNCLRIKELCSKLARKSGLRTRL